MFSLFTKFKEGLQKTAASISRKISGIFTGIEPWSPAMFASLEKVLVESDLGIAASRKIVADIRNRYELGELKSTDDISLAASAAIVKILQENARPPRVNSSGLTVYLFIGVNGSGKTTSIGKLAVKLAKQNKKVILAACDTFRAAAVEQLGLWAQTSGTQIVSAKQGADPASVAFDAMKAAVARKADFLLIDTAGRQQNSKMLMDELAKICRIIRKVMPEAPHETILTIDASQGINALSQAKGFAETAAASALILTKLDGTGKGGAACAVQQEFKLPILYAGLGEGPDDLQEFQAQSYADAIFSSVES